MVVRVAVPIEYLLEPRRLVQTGKEFKVVLFDSSAEVNTIVRRA